MNADLNIENYIPHRGLMKFIDQLQHVDDQTALSEHLIRADHPFYDPVISGVPHYFSIEWMAQTVAAFSGFHRKQSLKPPAIGLLLSVRRYQSDQASYPLGQKILIQARKAYLENNMGVFQCGVTLNERQVCQATLSTIQPPEHELKKILAGSYNDEARSGHWRQ